MKSLTLTRQLTIFIGGLVLVVAFVMSLLGYWFVRHELDQQARSRLVDAEGTITTALELEQARVENTVRLASQRPTLLWLYENQDSDELTVYLTDFLADTTLDFLFVTDSDPQFTVGTLRPENAAALTISLPLDDGGQITGGILLDANLEASLQQQSGLNYRFVPSTQDVSGNISTITIEGGSYYRRTIPLVMLAIDPPTSVESYLPLSGVLAGYQQVALSLMTFSLLVAGLMALAGGLFVRGRVIPVWRLASYARRIGQGDLQTPIEVVAKSQEVDTLVQSLDATRVHLQRLIQEVTEANQWAESLIQSVVEGIVTYDTGGSIVFFSEGAVQITGWAYADVIGQPVKRVFQLANDEGHFIDFVPPEGSRRTFAVLHHDGRTVDISITHAHPVRDRETTIVIHDVTEEINRRSVQAYFLANMSHEFKTPLAGMKASLELLLENLRYLSTEETEELLRSIFLSLSTLQSLIENLLESSKIEANHFVLRREEVAAEEAIAESIRLVQPLIDRRQQVVNVELPFVIPPLRVDRPRIIQAVVNLLTNASRYSPMESTIDVVVQYEAGDLHIRVLDRGPGIPEEKRTHVFRQFVRLDQPTQSDHGSGLGLAVVKAIVEAHGGQVGVDARQHGGASFWFSLPVNRPQKGV